MLSPMLLSTLAFAILTIARPEKRRRSGDTVITIPLTRRANSTQGYDGRLDYRWLSQGGHNTTYVRRDDKKTEKVVTTEDLKLRDDYVTCTGRMSFGTPPQPFDLVLFDTGSDITWICGPTSVIQTAKDPNIFDTERARNADVRLGIWYGDNVFASGEYYQGNVNLAGAEVELHFGVATNLEPVSKFNQVNGILGLSFPKKLRRGNLDPIEHSFFWKAIAEGRFSSPVFAFDLSSPTNSQAHFGGLSKDHYIGRPEYHSIIDQQPLRWELQDAKLYVNGYKPLLENLRTVIDTGTTNIIGPPSQVKKIYDKIGSCKMLPNSDGMYLYPCGARPVITFLWSKRRWTVSPEIFEREKRRDYPGMCIGAVQENKDLQEGEWLLGIAFLRNVYASFHVDTRQIAFARPRNSRRWWHGKKP